MTRQELLLNVAILSTHKTKTYREQFFEIANQVRKRKGILLLYYGTYNSFTFLDAFLAFIGHVLSQFVKSVDIVSTRVTY